MHGKELQSSLSGSRCALTNSAYTVKTNNNTVGGTMKDQIELQGITIKSLPPLFLINRFIHYLYRTSFESHTGANHSWHCAHRSVCQRITGLIHRQFLSVTYKCLPSSPDYTSISLSIIWLREEQTVGSRERQSSVCVAWLKLLLKPYFDLDSVILTGWIGKALLVLSPLLPRARTEGESFLKWKSNASYLWDRL